MLKYLIIFISIITTTSFSQDRWNPQNLKNQFGKYVDTTFEVSINPDLPNYNIRYREYYIAGNISPDLGTTYFRVDISRNDIDTVLQTIESSSDVYGGPTNYEYGFKEIGLKGMFIDYNFDGYKDIRFNYDSGVNAYAVNQFYEVYLYNPLRKEFELNDTFTDLCNPTPFPKEKIIRTYRRELSFDRAWRVATYHWENKRLILSRTDYFKIRDENSFDSLGWDESDFLHFIDYYKDNHIIKTDSTVIKAKNIPELYIF